MTRTRAQVPDGARIWVEAGGTPPSEVSYDSAEPFSILWVVTDGMTPRKFLWIKLNKTGLYVAHASPGGMHTSYHTDGTRHWKCEANRVDFGKTEPLGELTSPRCTSRGSVAISSDVLENLKLGEFDERDADRTADRVIYIDNRKIISPVGYEVWAVPPFRHSEVGLHTTWPAHIHVVTHTVPWIEVIIYEQGAPFAEDVNSEKEFEPRGEG